MSTDTIYYLSELHYNLSPLSSHGLSVREQNTLYSMELWSQPTVTHRSSTICDIRQRDVTSGSARACGADQQLDSPHTSHCDNFPPDEHSAALDFWRICHWDFIGMLTRHKGLTSANRRYCNASSWICMVRVHMFIGLTHRPAKMICSSQSTVLPAVRKEDSDVAALQHTPLVQHHLSCKGLNNLRTLWQQQHLLRERERVHRETGYFGSISRVIMSHWANVAPVDLVGVCIVNVTNSLEWNCNAASHFRSSR